jgi:hypothetical protein
LGQNWFAKCYVVNKVEGIASFLGFTWPKTTLAP